MSVIIQHKRGTASQWTTLNPTLAAGEVGWESDTNKFKIGTGSTAWTSLLYATLTPAQLSSTYASLTANNTFTGNQTWNNSVSLGPALNASVGFEIGYLGGTATTPYIDFHSGATAIDFDSRIIANGGNGTNGQGTLTYTAATNIFTGLTRTSAGLNGFGITSTPSAWGGFSPTVEIRNSSSSFSGINFFMNGGAFIRAYDGSGNAKGAWANDGSIVAGPSNTKLGTLSVYADTSGTIGQVIRGALNQSVDLLRTQDNSANTLSKIDYLGKIFVPGGTTIYDYGVETLGSTDTAWKKLIEVTCPTGLYTGASYQIDVVDNLDNYGVLANVPQRFNFHVKITRSTGTQDDTLAAAVMGPSVNYVRVVKTSSSLYEIQVRQPDIYRVVSFKIRRVVHSNTTESYTPSGKTYAGLDAGSTSGTIYLPVNDSTTVANFLVDNFSQVSSNRMTIQPLGTLATTTPLLTLTGSGTQNSNYLEIRNNAGTVLSGVTPAGRLYVQRQEGIQFMDGTSTLRSRIYSGGNNGMYFDTGGGSTRILTLDGGSETITGNLLYPYGTTRSGLIIRGLSGQTADLQQWQFFDGTTATTKAYVTPDGSFLTSSTLTTMGNLRVAGTASTGGGAGVIGIANAATAPASNPTGGGVLFVESGTLKYRGTSNAATTIVNFDGTTPYVGTASSYFAGHNPEGRLMYNTYLTNDMANARLRASAVSATQNGTPYSISNANWDAMFDGTATFFNISPTSGFTFPLVITVPLPRTLTYGAWVGLSFGSTFFRANSVTIEVFSLDSSSWVTIFTTTSNTSEDIFASVSGLTNSNATGINQVRYTISDPNSSQLRLQHLWAYNFNSDMWSQTMMPRGGGSFYGPISATTVSDAVVMSVRGAASGGASIQTNDLQRWQTWDGTTTTTRARIDSGGNLKASNVATLNSIAQLAESNSGGLFVMGRATAQASSPGLNTGSLYFRDGTTSGTLRLATRTGASGIEETIVDNLSSTGSTAGAQFVGAGGVRTSGLINTNSSQYGNNILFSAPASTTYYLLATLPISTAGTYDHLKIDAMYGVWTGGTMSTSTYIFSNRDAFVWKHYLSGAGVLGNVKLRAYSQVDGSVQIWASGEAGQFMKFAYNISSAQNVTTVAVPVSTTTAPSGTVVFDSSNVSTYPPVENKHGGLNIFGTATGTIPFSVRGVSGQTADLVKIQNNTPTDLFAISSAGLITAKVVSNAANQSRGILLSNTSDLWQSGLYLKSDGSGNPRLTLLAPTGALGEAISIDSAAKVGFNNINPTGQVDITTASTTRVPLIIRPQTSQTADLLQIRNSADNANLFRVTSSGDASLGALALGSGTIYGSSSWLNIVNSAASQIGIIVRGASGQSANLQEWQDSSPAILAKVDSVGAFTTNSANGYSIAGAAAFKSLNSGQTMLLTAGSAVSTNPHVVIRQSASQTGDLIQWQTSTPTTVASVSQTGVITTTGLTLSSTTSPITLNGSVGTSGQVLTSAGAGATPTWRDGPVDGTTTTATIGFGFMGLPQNATTTGAYTIAAADAGKHIYASATRTVTIDSNTNLALPIGTTLTFIAGTGATMTIAITSDTMYLAGPGTTGSRTLAPFGMATAVKLTSTTWMISGNGLT